MLKRSLALTAAILALTNCRGKTDPVQQQPAPASIKGTSVQGSNWQASPARIASYTPKSPALGAETTLKKPATGNVPHIINRTAIESAEPLEILNYKPTNAHASKVSFSTGQAGIEITPENPTALAWIFNCDAQTVYTSRVVEGQRREACFGTECKIYIWATCSDDSSSARQCQDPNIPKDFQNYLNKLCPKPARVVEPK